MTPLEIISRDYLLKTVKYYDGDDCVVKNYKDFEDEIVFWKVMLYEACNIRPGSNIAVYDRTIRFNYCTLFLAAAELGARLIVIPDYPVEGTPRNDKMDRFVEVYGRLDLCIFDDSAGTSQALIDLTNYYGNMTIVKTMLDTYEIQDHKNYELMSTTVFAKPEDIFIITTTSGSSGEPKLIPFLHRQMYRNGKRNVKVLGFNPEDRACHTRNMHHPFVLTDFFLPSLCGINHHYSIPFISASGLKNAYKYSVTELTFTSERSTSICSASIFEISTILLMILSMRAPLFSMIRIYFFCSSFLRSVSFSSSAKPRIPFIGVLIS